MERFGRKRWAGLWRFAILWLSQTWRLFVLVLSRKSGESILIGDQVKITVVRVNTDGRVRIGIEAPKTMNIIRPETLERERRE
jgi:carbon storage regulator